MARILSRALRHLSGGYLLEGSEVSTNHLDLGSLQLVQEASHLVAAGRGPGSEAGWVDACLRVQIAGGVANDVQFASVDPYDPTLVVTPDSRLGWPSSVPHTHDIFLYDLAAELVFETGRTPTLDALSVYLVQATDMGGPGNVTDARPARMLLADSDGTLILVGTANPHIPVFQTRISLTVPYFIPRGTLLAMRTETTDAGAGTDAGMVGTSFRIRAVPRGFPVGP